MNSPSRPFSAPPETLPANKDLALLEQVMAEFVEKQEKGATASPDEYIARYPQLAEELKSFFRNHVWMTGQEPSSIASKPLLGVRIGPYQIESEIARGGMGVVYRARQEKLGRTVALKLISSGVLADEEERGRFRLEAEAAARLHHPNIIAIHDIGSWEGYEYFSMTLVEGATLQQKVDGRCCSDRDAARIVRDIARGAAYAHRLDIVHRDLKPENILLSDDGRPLVADFGLAKWHREGAMLTRTGQVLGTPHYMSPEQASGCCDVTATSDIYSLGAILYAVLTGRPPHEGASTAEVLRSVLQDEPVSPRLICRDIPADLETICLKAMHYQPGMRYQTAEELADDLERYLTGEQISATGSNILDRVVREIHRDQHQNYFESWGRTLIGLGIIIFIAHTAIYLLDRLAYPTVISYWLPRTTMLLLIFASIYWARRGQVMPRTIADRPVWSIWIGYLASLATMNGLLLLNDLDERLLFPIASALSGFGFIAMGGHVWGGSAILGFAFLLSAVAAGVWLPFAPLIFGTAWLVNLIVLGWHYRSRREP